MEYKHTIQLVHTQRLVKVHKQHSAEYIKNSS